MSFGKVSFQWLILVLQVLEIFLQFRVVVIDCIVWTLNHVYLSLKHAVGFLEVMDGLWILFIRGWLSVAESIQFHLQLVVLSFQYLDTVSQILQCVSERLIVHEQSVQFILDLRWLLSRRRRGLWRVYFPGEFFISSLDVAILLYQIFILNFQFSDIPLGYGHFIHFGWLLFIGSTISFYRLQLWLVLLGRRDKRYLLGLYESMVVGSSVGDILEFMKPEF